MATPGRYTLDECTPEGNLVVVDAQQGQVMERPFSFRVNRAPKVQSQLDNGTWSAGHIARGRDGQLLDANGTLIASVNRFNITVNFHNTDYTPGGQKLIWSINQNYSCMLTFTSAMVRDAEIFMKVFAQVDEAAADVSLSFQGYVKGRA